MYIDFVGSGARMDIKEFLKPENLDKEFAKTKYFHPKFNEPMIKVKCETEVFQFCRENEEYYCESVAGVIDSFHTFFLIKKSTDPWDYVNFLLKKVEELEQRLDNHNF